MFLKTKRFWRLLLLGIFIVLTACFFLTTLELARMDFGRFRPYDWPRNLEYNSLFWIGMCMAAVEVQILFPCATQWVRLLRNQPAVRKEIPREAWCKRFCILTLAVILLSGIAVWRGCIYYPMYREQLDEAWIYANRYYPFVIADLFAIGLSVRCAYQGIKLRSYTNRQKG